MAICFTKEEENREGRKEWNSTKPLVCKKEFRSQRGLCQRGQSPQNTGKELCFRYYDASIMFCLLDENIFIFCIFFVHLYFTF